MGIVLIEKDLHHQIIMITMSLDEKLRKYMIEFMKITVFEMRAIFILMLIKIALQEDER